MPLKGSDRKIYFPITDNLPVFSMVAGDWLLTDSLNVVSTSYMGVLILYVLVTLSFIHPGNRKTSKTGIQDFMMDLTFLFILCILRLTACQSRTLHAPVIF